MFRLASPRLWVILRKEFAVVRNNPGTVLKPAVALTVVLMLVVYLVDSDNDTVRLGIVDESRSEQSRDLQSRFDAALLFEITTYASAAASFITRRAAAAANRGPPFSVHSPSEMPRRRRSIS